MAEQPSVPAQVLIALAEHLDAETTGVGSAALPSGVVRGVLDPHRATAADLESAIEVLTDCAHVLDHDEDPYAELVGEYRDQVAAIHRPNEMLACV